MSDKTADGESPDLDVISRVLGRTPSGVFILTAGDGSGRETGMLASWVQQASFEPPSVTVAVNRKRYLNDWLDKAPHAALNLLGASQRKYLKHFGRGFEPDQAAFEGLSTIKAANGITVLAEALGHLAGEVTESMPAGDHTVYLLRITSAAAGEKLDAEKPMVHIRKNGMKY